MKTLQCCAVINDLIGGVPDSAQTFERKIDQSNTLTNWNALSQNIIPLSYLTEPEIRLDKHGMVIAGKVPDVLASERCSKMYRSCNAIVFNTPDPISIYGLTDRLLASIGMENIQMSYDEAA